MMMRARKDAKVLDQVLYLVQAADSSTPTLPLDLAAKLVNKVNPGEMGGMHGMLPLHLGMHLVLRVHLPVHLALPMHLTLPVSSLYRLTLPRAMARFDA